MARKARIFVASSREAASVAYAIQENLASDAEVTVWDQNAANLSVSVLESLVHNLDRFDFAICVCTPTDRATIRDQAVDVARDNVIFEMGLFIGRRGRKRCFVVQPEGADLHLPSDFAGMLTARYDPNRSDRNLRAALGPACNRIREQIREELAGEEEPPPGSPKVRNIAVVCHRTVAGRIELLLTRTSGGRWILPKGRRAKPETVAEAVRTIGRTEAGAIGKVDPEPVGAFRFLKNDTNREQTLVAFLLAVEQVEQVAQSFRTPTWFEIGRAADALAEDRGAVYAEELRSVVERARSRLSGGSGGGGRQP